MVIKISWIFMALKMKTACTAVLGKDNYLRLHQDAKRSQKKPGEEEDYSRVINGQILGKELDKKGNGIPDVDPSVCDNPTTAIKARSNKRKDPKTGEIKGQDWFTCVKCQTRWERLPGPEKGASTGSKDQDPNLFQKTNQEMGDELINFGKYQGQLTYLQIYQEDRQYVDWVMATHETERSSPQLSRFAAWINQYEALKAEEELNQDEYRVDSDLERDMDQDREPSEEDFQQL